MTDFDKILVRLDWQTIQDLGRYLRNQARLKALDGFGSVDASTVEQELAQEDMTRRVAGALHLLQHQDRFPAFWERWVSRLTAATLHDPTEAMGMSLAFKIWNQDKSFSL